MLKKCATSIFVPIAAAGLSALPATSDEPARSYTALPGGADSSTTAGNALDSSTATGADTQGTVTQPAAKKSIQLIGRIEQLTNEADPTPPTLHPDGIIEGANAGPQKPTVPGFPRGFLGRWVGKIIIDKNDYGEMKKYNTPMYVRESGILFPGRTGIGQVIFSMKGDVVKAASALAQFLPTASDAKFMDKIKNVGANTHFTVRFGDDVTDAINIMGAKQSSRVTLDRTTELETSNFEQQIATATETSNPSGHADSHDTREIVLQFHQLNPRQMIVTMAQVLYSGRGAFSSKLIVHGTFSKELK